MSLRIIAILGLLILVGCKFSFDSAATPPPVVPPPAPNPLADCWNPSVKSNLEELAQSIASDNFNNSIPTDISSSNTDAIKASFTLSTENFITFSYDKDSGSLHCGAEFKYSYTRPDGSIFSHDKGDILSFEVYQGENGLEPSLSGSDQTLIEVSYQPSDGSAANQNPLSSGTPQ